jgi:cytochrome c556
MKTKPFAMFSAALIAGITLFTSFADAQVKPADALRYRKSAYHVLIWNWMPLANAVRGKSPYNKAEFERYSARVAQVAPMLLEGFPAGSGVGKTEAKPEVWTNWADFQLKMKAFETESAALALLAKGGDFEKIKVQFGKVGGTCKACHDKYKAD